MKISVNWLSDYIDLDDIDINWLVERLTVTTAEIEKVYTVENDTVIEIDNKSLTHRPDLWCHYGIAREVSAIINRPLKNIDVLPEESLINSELPRLNVSILDTEKYLRYSAISIENIKPLPTPELIKERLINVGVRPISLIVDLANYVMMDLGQPMHTFDKRYADEIRVYSTEESIKFKTLDDALRDVPIGTLMIGNKNNSLALAGIMGGKESEITEDTNGIFLESAVFDGVSIRKSSSSLGLRTDASIRFEKFLDTNSTVVAIGRFLRLLLDCQPEVKITSALYDDAVNAAKTIDIKIEHDYIETYLGNSVDEALVIKILEKLDFKVTENNNIYKVTVPTFRATKDITSKADLIEEILRSYGYDNIKPAPMKMDIVPVPEDSMKTLEYEIKDLLVEKFSFNEVHTYCWYDNEWLKRIEYEDKETLKIANSNIKQYEQLRTDIIPNLLKAAYNNRKEYNSFKIFEIGRVYLKQDTDCRQPKHLGAVMYNNEGKDGLKKAFLDMKGICDYLIQVTKAAVPQYKTDKVNLKWTHKGNQVQIYYRDIAIGYICSLEPSLLQLFGNKCNIIIMDINLDILDSITKTQIKYEPVSKYPETYLDFSILTESKLPYESIYGTVNKFSNDNLLSIEYIDTYEGQNVPANMKSTTMRLIVGNKNKTLTLEELDNIKTEFIKHLEHNNMELR